MGQKKKLAKIGQAKKKKQIFFKIKKWAISSLEMKCAQMSTKKSQNFAKLKEDFEYYSDFFKGVLK